jgi:hypothetical protein
MDKTRIDIWVELAEKFNNGKYSRQEILDSIVEDNDGIYDLILEAMKIAMKQAFEAGKVIGKYDLDFEMIAAWDYSNFDEYLKGLEEKK